MFSRWEKVSGAIMEAPTLGTGTASASGKSGLSRGGRKKYRPVGRAAGKKSCFASGEGAREPFLVMHPHDRHEFLLAVHRGDQPHEPERK